MINFYLPGVYELFGLNAYLIELKNTIHPEWFHEDVHIASVYGCFPNSIWNSGRSLIDAQVSINDVDRIVAFYNTHQVGVRFTFTNGLLEKHHLQDVYCNLLCDIISYNTINEILVSSDILEEYLRDKYPKTPLISSITKCLETVDNFNKELKKDYKYVVLPTHFNHDEEILQNISQKEKVEILLNCGCLPHCPRKREHYDFNSRAQLYYGDLSKCGNFSCSNYKANFYEAMKRPNTDFCTFEDLQKLVQMGYNHFKIEGRDALYNGDMLASVVEAYVYYLVKPEYQNECRLALNTHILINGANIPTVR